MRISVISRSLVVGIGFLLAVVLIWGCGRMPSSGFWEPAAADSAGIDTVVKANKELLMLDFAESGFQFLKWVVPETIIKKALRDNPFRQRFQCDSLQHIFSVSGRQFTYSFVAIVDTAGKETTATVTIIESIPGTLRLHALKYTRFLFDSTIITPSETLRLKYYDSVFTDTSMIVEKPITSVVTGGCVLRKENGDWKLWKIAGGQRFFAPNPEDAPSLYAVDINNGDTTIRYLLWPDTTQFGVKRLYGHPEELLKANSGESLWVNPVHFYTTDANFFYFYIFKGRRYLMGDTAKIRFGLPDTGFQRLYAVKVPYEVLYDAGGELNAAAWGIPIYVKGGKQ